MRLRGDLSCVQIIIVISSHFASWTTLGHSHAVECHFRPPPCTLMRSKATSSHLFALSWGRMPFRAISLPIYSLSRANLSFPYEKGGYPEVRLPGPSLTELQNPSCGHRLCSKNSSNPTTIRNLDHFVPLLCAPMPCIAISMLTSCEISESIVFPQ